MRSKGFYEAWSKIIKQDINESFKKQNYETKITTTLVLNSQNGNIIYIFIIWNNKHISQEL